MIINIACGVTAGYLFPLRIMLQSLERCLRPGWSATVYVFHTGLPEDALGSFGDRIEVRPVRLTVAQLNLAISSSSYPPEGSLPAYLPEVVDLDRALFLDADMLVLDDIVKLWEVDLEGCPIGACQDGAIQRCSLPRGVRQWREYGIPADHPYFNAGVLLMDLKKLREMDAPNRIREAYRRAPAPVDFMHQQAMNAVLFRDWKHLDARWNLIGSLAGRSMDEDSSGAWRQPGIVHFAGRRKPWRQPTGGPFYSAYRTEMVEAERMLPGTGTSFLERCWSFYDIYLREALYPLESLLWRKGFL